MLEAIIVVFAIFGLTFLLKESDGPWGLIGLFRGWLFRQPKVGVFFYKLFDCYFCLGFHCGWIVYLLYVGHLFLILWALAGAAISFIFNILLSKLSTPHS